MKNNKPAVIPLSPPLEKGEIPRSLFFKGGLGELEGNMDTHCSFSKGIPPFSWTIFLA
ncbi:hypothetical protein KSU1_B0452 [Candidatus Jettenia caeni]|uniref:Uncharacterized protein n=1 Tax=Candidatus Jettenia caeni TaxID=247490 RepID=I3IHW4_9BACT|nr:hypothetical protein KSU1_B0452 [Candidatus Jettenia caeni]